LSDIDNDVLANVLKFHVLAADVKAADLTDSYVTALATGPNDEQISLQIDVTGGVKFNGVATPTTTDVITSNGTVHIIDAVMLPPSVVNLALNNPAFSTLVAALTREDLTTDYVSVLSGAGPFTVFAPTNDAFQALLDSNPDWSSLNDIPVATLEAVLNYHVVSGANVQSDELSDNQEIATLGGTVTIDLTDGAKVETTSGQSASVIIADVQGSNGVVHAVNAVLVP
jgi:transforming growth factor-beta-induced protein